MLNALAARFTGRRQSDPVVQEESPLSVAPPSPSVALAESPADGHDPVMDDADRERLDALSVQCEEQEAALAALGVVLASLAEGDLDADWDSSAVPERYRTLTVDVGRLIGRLEQTMETLAVTGAAVQSSRVSLGETIIDVSAFSEIAYADTETVLMSSDNARDNIQAVAAATEEMSATIAEIGSQLRQSVDMAATAAARSDEATATTVGLNEASEEIESVVGLIGKFASQTNLLALNATIEAARAGEAGRGFAVVANEVKHLATQTAQATNDISERVRKVQEHAHETARAIEEIKTVVDTLNGISEGIAAAVEEQEAATQEIARSVNEVSKATVDMNENIAGVAHRATETSFAAAHSVKSLDSLQDASMKLADALDTF